MTPTVGLSPKSIHVLVPGSEPLVAKLPMSEAEQPGMGKAIGASSAARWASPVARRSARRRRRAGGRAGGRAAQGLFVYEDALRRGYAIVVVMPADSDEHERAVAVLEARAPRAWTRPANGGGSAFRETEVFEYRADGLDFQRDEAIHREGFEAALSRRRVSRPGSKDSRRSAA